MELTDPADRIWNRAAGQAGDGDLGPGDRALAALLLAHGLACNGGVIHCIEGLSPDQIREAGRGFQFFEMVEVADFLAEAQASVTPEDARTGNYPEELESELDDRYYELVPDDGVIEDRFRRHLEHHPGDFAPA